MEFLLFQSGERKKNKVTPLCMVDVIIQCSKCKCQNQGRRRNRVEGGEMVGLKIREKKGICHLWTWKSKNHNKKTKNKAYALKSQPKPKERGQVLPLLYLEGIFLLLLFLFFQSYVLWYSNTFFFFLNWKFVKVFLKSKELRKKKS